MERVTFHGIPHRTNYPSMNNVMGSAMTCTTASAMGYPVEYLPHGARNELYHGIDHGTT